MKKILLCALCLVLSVCTAITAEAVQTNDVPSRDVISAEPSGSANYAAYVQDVLVPKYGYANTNPIKAAVSSSNYSNTWAKRKGILGYDTADFNNDGKDEMVVYLLRASDNDNKIDIEYYTSDYYGNITRQKSINVYAKSSDYMEYHAGAEEHCVGGIIERNGKKCVLVESHYRPFPAADYHVKYRVFECNSSGEFVKQYYIMDEVYTYVKTCTLKSNGKYSVQRRNFNGFKTFKTALVALGFPSDTANSSTIGKTLGCKTTDEVYTYFNTPYEKKSFYLISNFVSYSNNLKTYNFVNYAGMYPAWNHNEVITTTPPAALGNGTKYGDLDGDNKITSADALLILRASVKLENLNSKQSKLADVNKDGSVDSVDSLEVLRYSVGLSLNANINKTA